MELTTIPTPEDIRTVNTEMQTATRENYEDWRAAVTDNLRESGALTEIMKACTDWALAKVQGGMSLQQAGFGASGGMIASAFQLGLIMGARLHARQEAIS